MEPEEFHKREISYIKNQDDVRNPFFFPLLVQRLNPPDTSSLLCDVAWLQEKVKAKLEEFKRISTYVSGAYDEDAAFENLEKHLQDIEKDYTDGEETNRIYYVRYLLLLQAP
jgi:hypothetical protein